MRRQFDPVISCTVIVMVVLGSVRLAAQQEVPAKARTKAAAKAAQKPADPAAEATAVRAVPADRPEQQLSGHDRSDVFDWKKPAPLTDAFKGQPKEGRLSGYDFARDPLNADAPFTTFEEVMKKESAMRP